MGNAYGPQGYPAVGNGMPGLPVRSSSGGARMKVLKRQYVELNAGNSYQSAFDFGSLRDIQKTSFRVICPHAQDGSSAQAISGPQECFPFMGDATNSQIDLALARPNNPNLPTQPLVRLRRGVNTIDSTGLTASFSCVLVITEYEFNYEILRSGTIPINSSLNTLSLNRAIKDINNVRVTCHATSLGTAGYMGMVYGTFAPTGYYPDASNFLDICPYHQANSSNYYTIGAWFPDALNFSTRGSAFLQASIPYVVFELKE